MFDETVTLAHTKLVAQSDVFLLARDIAQLVFHTLELSGISVLGVCDDDPKMIGRDFCGREIVSSSQIRFIAPDAVIITDNQKTEEILGNLQPLLQRGIELIRLDNRPETRSVGFLKAGSRPSSLFKDRDRMNEAIIKSLSNRSLK